MNEQDKLKQERLQSETLWECSNHTPKHIVKGAAERKESTEKNKCTGWRLSKEKGVTQ